MFLLKRSFPRSRSLTAMSSAVVGVLNRQKKLGSFQVVVVSSVSNCHRTVFLLRSRSMGNRKRLHPSAAVQSDTMVGSLAIVPAESKKNGEASLSLPPSPLLIKVIHAKAPQHPAACCLSGCPALATVYFPNAIC